MLLQIDLWSDLGNVIETRELFLGYQLQINIASGKIELTEALLRWNHSSREPIRTDKLVQVAEGAELMSKFIGKAMPLPELIEKVIHRSPIS